MIANSKQQDLRTLSIDEVDVVTGGIAVGGCFPPDRAPKGPKGKVVSVPTDSFPTCPAPDRL